MSSLDPPCRQPYPIPTLSAEPCCQDVNCFPLSQSHCRSILNSCLPSLPRFNEKSDAQRGAVASRGAQHGGGGDLLPFLQHGNWVERKGTCTGSCDLLRSTPCSGGIAINTIFCTVWPTWAGDHRSFRAVVWVAPTAFQLGVRRKITAQQDCSGRSAVGTRRTRCIPQHPSVESDRIYLKST